MKKYTLGKIIDYIFKNTLVFFIAFIWIRFYIKTLYLSLFLSVIITLLFGLVITLKNQKNLNTKKLTCEENKQISICTNEFLFSNHFTNLNFFNKLANKKHTSTIINEFILIKNNGFKIALFPYYETRILTIDTATNIYIKCKELAVDKLVITCKNTNQEALNFAKQLKNIKLLILEEKQAYFKLLKTYETYPKITNKLIQEDKLTLKQILMLAFNRKKTKGYLFSGVILFFASFVIKYNIYYIVFSSLLFIMALFSYSNAIFNKKMPENVLD